MVASNYFYAYPVLVELSTQKAAVEFGAQYAGKLWMMIAEIEFNEEVVMAKDSTQVGQEIAQVKVFYRAFGGAKCRIEDMEITTVYMRKELEDCLFELGRPYRISLYIEDFDKRSDGTLKTIDIKYFGGVRDASVPFSMPVPSSDRWLLTPTTSVDSEWRVEHLEFFSDISCTKVVAIYPAPYRDPFGSSLGDEDAIPNGAAFSHPGPLPSSSSPLGQEVCDWTSGQPCAGWTSGQPCAPSVCHIGFAFGTSDDSPTKKNFVQVGCVRVVQSADVGTYATDLQLQYWSEGTGYVAYRSISGLTGGAAFLPTFDGFVPTF